MWVNIACFILGVVSTLVVIALGLNESPAKRKNESHPEKDL
jgi:hypothetical protein